MEYLAEYGLFLAKVVTWVIAILIVIMGIVAACSKGKAKIKGKLTIKNLNEKYQEMQAELQRGTQSKKNFKSLQKIAKQAGKKTAQLKRKNVYVLNFHGDIKASAVQQLREEITSIVQVATTQDEVVVCLESQGGMVHSYGLAASQLARLRQQQIPLTVIVDKVAASGGYLMACVANHIYAAPFAIIGSIGVLAQLPNFHRFLRKHDIDFEQLTAGEYKRTLSLFGKNTEKGREKFQEEIEEVHQLFKQFIIEYRPGLDVESVATGEHWHGIQALHLNLVDGIFTSDDYLLNASKNANVYQVSYPSKKTLLDKISLTAQLTLDKVLQGWRQQQQDSQLL